MIFKRWSLWRFIITYLAKAQGFLDPMVLFSQIQRFSRPSEVWVPAELLRLGMVLQARGILNSQAIQNNLDWVWPYWVEEQFNPKKAGFIPRSFSLAHINLTHRNWTALGVPDCSDYALVDPRGLVTPLFDGWSVDAWIITKNMTGLIPSQISHVYQQIRFDKNIQVITFSELEGMSLQSVAEVHAEAGRPTCRISYYAQAPVQSWLLVCIRPYNAEGVSLIDIIQRLPNAEGWMINEKFSAYLKQTPSAYIFSNYQLGDILGQVSSTRESGIAYEDKQIQCSVGMATATAMYELLPHQAKEVSIEIPIPQTMVDTHVKAGWEDHLQGSATMEVPDPLFQSLYETALMTLILHSPKDIYPGPYTYKRFWFRDAAFIVYAMVAVGLTRNMEKILSAYPQRQTRAGYFNSQDGEWDSNGQAIWAIERFARMTCSPVSDALLSSVEKGAQWIKGKRVSHQTQSGHSGLLPAGFSAEHFGPTDFYYWDDFWSVAGLESASSLVGQKNSWNAQVFKNEGNDLRQAIEESLKTVKSHLGHGGIPASPYRRMDAGAIGSLVASYPLQLYPPKDKRILATANFLMHRYFLRGLYYHELSHSGINIYMSLELAQVLLRAGDERFFDIVKNAAQAATPTGQWPEAIHPQTKGGCMGDGQHVWAAAEWILMMRNMFVREEEKEQTVILCSGIPSVWLNKKQHLFFGPTNTLFGKLSVTIDVDEYEDVHVSWQAQWRGKMPRLEIHLAGYENYEIKNSDITHVDFKKVNRKVIHS